MVRFYSPLGSHCAISNPEVLGQPEEEAELGPEMLGDLEEEGPGGVHPGKWLQNIPSPLHSLQPIASFSTAHQRLPVTSCGTYLF